ncbi:hypothetical protein [Halosimplex halobium]|uniref:hypothetical protein n=1 Tax=Halosimplex halobium TaxID=3396618 RepID=UPI003F5628CC
MSTLESSKKRGDSVESAVIDADPALEFVGDSVATWHDARTTECLDPSYERPFLGVPLVERDTEVEIKGACETRSAGVSRQRSGAWYIKRQAHERLLEAGGVYLLAVYGPRPDTPILRSVIVPASILDEHLDGRWYEVDADRSETEVAQLTWTVLIDRERVPGPAEVSR